MTTSSAAQQPLYTNEQIDDIVDKHIFLDNGTSTYRVWEDRANKYLRQMRDEYEARIAVLEKQIVEARKPMRVIKVPDFVIDLEDE